MTNYRKAFAAAAGAIATLLVGYFPSLQPVGPELTQAIVGLLTVAAVYFFPNTPPDEISLR